MLLSKPTRPIPTSYQSAAKAATCIIELLRSQAPSNTTSHRTTAANHSEIAILWPPWQQVVKKILLQMMPKRRSRQQSSRKMVSALELHGRRGLRKLSACKSMSSKRRRMIQRPLAAWHSSSQMRLISMTRSQLWTSITRTKVIRYWTRIYNRNSNNHSWPSQIRQRVGTMTAIVVTVLKFIVPWRSHCQRRTHCMTSSSSSHRTNYESGPTSQIRMSDRVPITL